jgi:hypothetical protein
MENPKPARESSVIEKLYEIRGILAHAAERNDSIRRRILGPEPDDEGKPEAATESIFRELYS